MELLPDGSCTCLMYRAEAQVGGKLAQVGARLIDAAVKKVAVGFFGTFEQKLARQDPIGMSDTPALTGEPVLSQEAASYSAVSKLVVAVAGALVVALAWVLINE